MKFQTILLIFFGLMAVVGVIAFSQPSSDKKDSPIGDASGNVAIWGTFPLNVELTTLIAEFNKTYKDSFSISYQFHDPKTFDNEIVEALASGIGPDILLLPDDLIIRHSDKIAIIPYTSVPQSVFTTNFIQAAEVYMRPDGVVALPFAIDPMVLYWNRDIFNNSSVTLPPKYWDEFLSLTPKLTRRDNKTQELTQSTIALGEYVNVNHAKDVLALLFLQVGNPILSYENGKPIVKLAVQSGGGTFVPKQDIVSAFRFFMDFSNPTKSIYTWSRAKNNSQNEFINGNLAMHLDFSSSHKEIELKNPHLNFGVAGTPQPRGTSAEVTFAKVYGLSVLKSSKNQKTAFIAITKLLTDEKPAQQFADAFDLPPVRRDLLARKPTDAALSVFYDAAIRARTWLDPKPEISDRSFQSMVESVSSGRENVSSAISKLQTDLEAALRLSI